MQRSEALSRLATAKIAHLATVTSRTMPHVVAVTFALVGDSVATMVDHKPKTTHRLQRILNVEHNGRASLLVDYYSDDWSRLWWVRIDGPASIHQGDDYWQKAGVALVAKYTQYRKRPPEGPAIRITLEKVSSWECTP